jgi:hypothetical protein
LKGRGVLEITGAVNGVLRRLSGCSRSLDGESDISARYLGGGDFVNDDRDIALPLRLGPG